MDPTTAYREITHAEDLDAPHSEAFLNVASKYWLSSPELQQVRSKLARNLMKNHDDPWLSDFVSAPVSPKAVSFLRSAITANDRGDPQQAERDAELAARLFRHDANSAGEARSLYELDFALHRQQKATQCVETSLRLASLADTKSYHWIGIQNWIEASICEEMRSNFQQAQELIIRAREVAKRFHYSGLTVRAFGKEASFQDDQGRVRQSWSSNEAGLRIFWEGFYAPEYGQQFYSDLGFLAEKANQRRLAVALQREALAMLADSQHTELKALAHFRLGTAAARVGELETAEKELQLANDLFRKLPSNSATHRYKAEVTIYLAELQAFQRNIPSAEELLESVKPTEDLRTFKVQVPYWKVKAQVEHAKGNTMEEARCLTRAILSGYQGYRSLNSEKELWLWQREVRPAYLQLLELELQRPHDVSQILAGWESFRYAEAHGSFSPDVNRDVKATRHLLQQTQKLTDATLVSFAVLPHGVTMWTADNRGISEFHADADPETLQAEVQAFLTLCSDPAAPVGDLRMHGSHLYAQLLAPLGTAIDVRRKLLIAGDAFLSTVPWAAIVAPDGAYFGSKHNFLLTPGIFYHRPRWSKPVTDVGQKVLLAVPGAASFGMETFPPLPDADAEAHLVSEIYPRNSILLRNTDVNTRRLLNELPNVSLFVFAGHGIIRDSGGELLLSGSEMLSAADLASLRMHHCTLVVLSACSTASVEHDLARNPDGLVRGFLAAGAGTVIASRWDVDSAATRKLMRSFYQSLREGKPVEDALRMAREDLRLKRATEHPYYWASFEAFATTD